MKKYIIILALFASCQKAPVIGSVPSFSLTNQEDSSVSSSIFKGRVSVVNFFFTACKGICPKMNTSIKDSVYSLFRDDSSFQVVSFTSDPANDDPSTLKAYHDSLGIAHWTFLTGREQDIYALAKNTFKVDDPNGNKDGVGTDMGSFIHTQFACVVDKDGKIRGRVFDTLKDTDVKEMNGLIKSLL